MRDEAMLYSHDAYGTWQPLRAAAGVRDQWSQQRAQEKFFFVMKRNGEW